jgi:hypothetical protein
MATIISSVQPTFKQFPKTETGLKELQECRDTIAKSHMYDYQVDWTTNTIIYTKAPQPVVPTIVAPANGIYVTPGAYKLQLRDGTFGTFIVVKSRQSDRLYAKKMIDAPSGRLTKDGKHVDFDFDYEAARGVIYKLRPEHKLTPEEFKAMAIQYDRCVVCGRTLKVAKSIEQMMGDVCFNRIYGGA